MITFEENEIALKKIHRHWLFFLSQLFFYVFLAILPLVAYLILISTILSSSIDIAELPQNVYSLLSFLYSGYILILWFAVCASWTDYYLDIWIITDRRILDIEQIGLFQRRVSELRFDMIQDVSTEVPSFIATIFGYGTIKVQTASEKGDFEFYGASNPEEMHNFVMGLHQKAVEKQREVKFSDEQF